MVNRAANLRSKIWDKHPIVIRGAEAHTAFGTQYGEPQTVMGSITATERTVTNTHGDDVLVSATLRWSACGPLPDIGALITLPPQFGARADREVVTSRRVVSGTGLTPDHVEVTVK